MDLLHQISYAEERDPALRKRLPQKAHAGATWSGILDSICGLRMAAGVPIKKNRTSVLQPKELDSTKSRANSKGNSKVPKEYIRL